MKEMKRILALVLCFAMLVGLMPAFAFQAKAAESVVVIAGSDYQKSNSGTTMTNIMNQIKGTYSSVYGILMGGDYDAGDVYPSASHLTAVDNTISAVYPDIADENRIMIQGNHETYGNLSPDNNDLLDATGAHDTDYYGVYAINYEDFDSAASGLQTYLNGKSGSQPIFVMSHQPLHVTSRGDNNAAVKLFNVLNSYDDLNIIFLFGHNHSGGYDAYLGNGSIYLPKGSSITVAGGSTSTLNFTYMNYGYVGYVNGSADTTLTMTAFEITDTQVAVKRYDASGLHNLKAAGATVSGYNTDSNVYGTAVIDLSTGESTISAIGADSGDDNTGSGDNSGTTGGSGYTYELVTSIEAGEKYVIVGNDDAVALMDNDGSFGSQTVTISGTTLTSDVALTEWTISGTSGGTIVSDQGNGLSYSSSSFNLTGAADNTFDITAVSNNFTILTVRSNSYYSKYYFNYDGSGWTSKPTSAAYVRLYKLTGTGTGGGSTVTPEGGDWVTITDGKGKIVYKLDKDGIDTGVEYLIVAESVAKAMNASGTTITDVDVEIVDELAYVDSEDYGWEFSSYGSNGAYYIQLNGEGYLYITYNTLEYSESLSSSAYRNRFFITNNNDGTYVLARSNSGGTAADDYQVSWDGSEFTENTGIVRLYKYETTQSAGEAEYAKLNGELTYTVERGADRNAALALVMEGIDVVVSGDKTAETTLEDTNENITWELANTYDGVQAGEYAVVIKYKGVTLGTAKVIVPDVAVTGCTFDKSGSVKVGDSGKVRTGANITVLLEDGTSYKVPITMDMLSKDGAAVSTDEGGVIEGITVTFVLKGETYTINDFVLTVREPSPYPEYPDEGAVQVNKTGTGIQFQSTGVAQIEVSASGIPMNQGVDVLLVLDTSSSMGMTGSLTDGRTRIDVLKECVNALIANLQAERADGSVPDVSIAVVHFNGYTGNKNTNYIGSTARDTSTLGGVLTSDDNGGAWVNVQNMGSNWAANIPDDCSGTNYDHGLLLAYDLLAARQEAESSRKQFVLFMSDGAPFQYNGVNSNSLSSDWENWILGSYTTEEVEALSHVENDEFYFGNNNGNGQKHRVAEAIKGTGSFDIVVYSDTSSSGVASLKTVPGLGVTMYSVGLALEASNMPTDVAGQEAILKTIASSEDVFYSVTSATGLQEAFDDFAGEVLMAATNARFVDQMGTQYKLQMGTITDLDGEAIGVENKIEIISYDIWTRSDYLAGNCTEDKIGDRKGTFTVLEEVTFNADGSEVYSNKDSIGPNGETITAGDNILIDGVIYASSFWYNNNATAVEITGVDIPTGVGSDGLTTGSTNKLPAETFYWKVGTIKTTELAMRYFVYLEGSKEGTLEAGSYPTNEYAILYYNNYLNQPTGQPCQKPTFSPVMAWAAANVSYAFYLVDENGKIIVNQTTGETGSFANKVAVTNPVVYREILLNNLGQVNSIDVQSTGVLPAGYELYDDDSVYTIRINSDSTGEWTIVKDPAKVASTYVTHFDPDDADAYTNALTSKDTADYTHTIVWFAVVWKVQALPDSVVIDYGLPVDISVLTNDMFGENGKLVAVGSAEGVNLDGHETELGANFLADGQPKTSHQATYGDAEVRGDKVRYTPDTMEMNGYDLFAYAVNYSGSQNPGYYYDTVTVIPATTIYYEDNFLTLNGSGTVWEDEGTAVENAVQAEDRPGQFSLTDANNIYGFDAVNNGMSQFSLGTAKKVHVYGDSYATATFSFWGTGFDIISMTSNTTGVLAVQLKDAAGNVVDSKIVNTYYGVNYEQLKNEDGSLQVDENGNPVMGWVPHPEVDKAMYQVPVMQASNLTYGNYTVVITATYVAPFDDTTAEGYDLYLDAIRIYDPANDGAVDDDNVIEDAYVKDHEGWPTYFELRNKLIAAGSFDNVANDALNTDIEGLVFIDGKGTIGDAQISDYQSFGPNNEVYLAKNQSVAFKLSDVTVQKDGKTVSIVDQIALGIKSADGRTVTYTIMNVASNSNSDTGVEAGDQFNEKTFTVDTATDMYYNITGWKGDIIVITNTSDSILSLTNIKATYKEDPNGASVADEDQQDGGVNALSTAAVEAESNQVYAYMTPAAATLTLRSMNAPAVQEPEITEPTEPETEPSVPETEPAKPDNTELKAAVQEARKLNSKDYTRESYNAMVSALRAAEKVLKNKKATQAQIDEALANLNEAVAALEAKAVKPDNSQLKAAVEEAKKLKAGDYTKKSYDVLNNALKAAERVLKNKKATQAQIDEALEDLNEAVAGLEIKAAKPSKPGSKPKAVIDEIVEVLDGLFGKWF